MKKALLGLGIILLFIGIVTLSMSYSVEESEKNLLVKREEDLPVGEWRISARYNQSENLLVFFRPPKREGIPDSAAIIDVNITDPEGGNTTFRVVFWKNGDTDINLTSNDGGLAVPDPLEGVGGTTKYEGLYTVYAYTYLPLYYYPPNGTLPSFELYKVVVERKYPYHGFLPVSVGLIAAGAILSIWGTKSSKKPSRLVKKRLKKQLVLPEKM